MKQRSKETHLPIKVAAALAELKAAFQELYSDRLRGLYLFGSYARGDYRDDSDIDVLLLLAGPVSPGEEISRYSRVRSDICLRHDLVITIIPVSEDKFGRQVEPVYQKVRREGIPV